jgi:hypothetical protein
MRLPSLDSELLLETLEQSIKDGCTISIKQVVGGHTSIRFQNHMKNGDRFESSFLLPEKDLHTVGKKTQETYLQHKTLYGRFYIK